MKHTVQSLPIRLVIWLFFLIAIPLVIVAFVVHHVFYSHYSETIQNLLLQEARLQAMNIAVSQSPHAILENNDSYEDEKLVRFVIDEGGTYRSHSDKDKIGASIESDFPQHLLNPIFSDKSGVLEDADSIFAFSPVEEQNLKVIIIGQKKLLYKSLSGIDKTSGLWLSAILIAAFLSAALFLKKTVGDPLVLLTQTARQVEQSGLDIRFDENKMQDSLEYLADVFNKIPTQLHQLLAEKKQQSITIEKIRAALDESEERHRTIFNGVRDALLLLDLNGKVLDANPLACSMYGMSKEEILTRTSFDLIPPEHQESMKKFIAENIFTSKPFQYVNRRANGEQIIIELNPIINRMGGKEVVFTVVRDITDKKQAETALIESQRRLSTLMDNLMGMAYRCQNDDNWTIEFASEGSLELTGYKSEALINNRQISYKELIHPEDYELVRDEILTAINEHRSYVIIYRIICASGQEKWVMEKGQGIYNENGETVFIEGFIFDITERKLFEDALHESEERYRLLFEKAGEGIFLVQRNTKRKPWIISANKIGANMHGYSVDQLISKEFSDLIAPEQKEIIENTILSFQLGQWKTGISLHIKSDQTCFPVEYTAGYIKLGKHNYVLIFYRDITEREMLQAQMMRSEKLANLGSLAAGIAHELNSPLQIITGSSESLLKSIQKSEPVETARLMNNLEMINRNGWRCAEIVHSLLAYARPNIEQMQSENLNEIIHDTLLLIQHQLQAWSNISIDNELAGSLPDIHCDRNKISQVVINLLTNARDSMPDGGAIHIETRFDALNRHVILEVRDNGCGISNEIKDKIFDPFFTTKKIGKGTGLGLSIVSSIIEVHGGKIIVNSQPNQGAVFTILLPEASEFQEKVQNTTNIMGRYGEYENNALEEF